MAGINYPLWTQLKTNIVTLLEEVATEETLIDPARNFIVEKDRYRPWIEAQQTIPLVNVMVQNTDTNSGRSGNKSSTMDNVNVIVDMYAIGQAGEILPADQVASDRLDLLTAQVREALTRLKERDYLFARTANGLVIDGNNNFSLTYYDQESEQATRQYAPARWSFTVQMPFVPTDNNNFADLTELNISVKQDDLVSFGARFNYDNEDIS